MGEATRTPVALVLVSHSKLIAEGARELAQAMAPEVHIGAAGGDSYGGLGSSFDLIEAQIDAALEVSDGNGVVVLTDLGSATLTVDAVIEFAHNPDLVRYAPGPLVEGSVAAAVSAQGGGSIGKVVAAVASAARSLAEESSPGQLEVKPKHIPEGEDVVSAEAVVSDRAGLHARPAAKLALVASRFRAKTWIDTAECDSALEIMGLGIIHGQRVTVRACGPDAEVAAGEIADAIEAGFDEVAPKGQ